jgi:hypothetical protein
MGSHLLLTGDYGDQMLRVVAPPELRVRPGETLHLRPRTERIVWLRENGESLMGTTP